MPAMVNIYVRGAASAPVRRPLVPATYVVYAAPPMGSPNEPARAAQATGWVDWRAPLDEEPTWEDAEWQ